MEGDSSSDDEQIGGLAPATAQSKAAMRRVYDGKLSQARFTGMALLDPSQKRLRPTQAMDYWTVARQRQQTDEKAMARAADAAPSAVDAIAKLRQALDRVGLSAGPRSFWKALRELHPQHTIEWKEASAFYTREGGQKQVKSIAQRQQTLDPDKRRLLEQLFYGAFDGAIGQEALWEALRSDPKQREAMASSTGGYGHISRRDLNVVYNTLESTQLYRNAPALSKTRVKVPSAEELQPLARLQADSISLKGTPSDGYSGVINIIDIFSQYTWQLPVRTVGSAEAAAAALDAFVAQVKKRFGSWPGYTIVIQCDNGPEFSAEWRDAAQRHGITVQGIPAYSSNTNGDIENANKVWRGVMRRMLANRGDDISQWASAVPRINEIMNSRPNERTDWLKPSEVLRQSLQGDADLIGKVSRKTVSRAEARRGPSKVTAFKAGQKVRIIDEAYLTAKLRSNEAKTKPRWSRDVYSVRDNGIKGADSATMIPEYILEAQEPSDRTQKRLKPPPGEKYRWFTHDLLQPIFGTVVKAPTAVVLEPREVDDDARPYAGVPNIQALKSSKRIDDQEHKLTLNHDIEIFWLELGGSYVVPPTVANLRRFRKDVGWEPRIDTGDGEYERATVLEVGGAQIGVKVVYEDDDPPREDYHNLQHKKRNGKVRPDFIAEKWWRRIV